jgi:hypothetical protein
VTAVIGDEPEEEEELLCLYLALFAIISFGEGEEKEKVDVMELAEHVCPLPADAAVVMICVGKILSLNLSFAMFV